MAKGQMRSNKEKKKTEGRQEPQEGRGRALAVRYRQDAGGPKPQQQEVIFIVVAGGKSANGSAQARPDDRLRASAR